MARKHEKNSDIRVSGKLEAEGWSADEAAVQPNKWAAGFLFDFLGVG